MSRTVNRTITRTLSASEYIANALAWDERATVARLAAYRADRDGDADTAHAATKEWANAAHFVRIASQKGARALASEGRNPRELIDAVMHARECRARDHFTSDAGPPLA
jgi:hypothetical protein